MKIEHIGLILFFLWIGLSIFFGERIPANSGIGYDGVNYALIAQKFKYAVTHHELSSYVAQRIFPSFLIYCVSRIGHFFLTAQNIPLLFSLLNASMLLVCMYVWNLLGKELKWSREVKIISFAGLFLNFANFKMAFYDPVLTDTTAFTIGLCMIYCYLAKKNLALFIISLIGAFTFPTLLCMGMILFLFPINDKESTTLDFKHYNPILGSVIGALIATISIYVSVHYAYPGALGKNYSFSIFCLSCSLLFIYFLLVFKYLTPSQLKVLVSSIRPVRLLIVICTVATVAWAIHSISGDQRNPLTLLSYFIYIITGAVAYPLNFVISHTLYFGAMIPLVIWFWKDIAAYISQKGLGLLFLTGMYAILFMGTESRQLSNFIPIIVVMVAEMLNKKPISARFVTFFVILNLALSRFWLPLNHGDWSKIDYLSPPLMLEFPLQWFFMNMGPWMAQISYWIFSTATALTFFCIYIALKKEKKSWQ